MQFRIKYLLVVVVGVGRKSVQSPDEEGHDKDSTKDSEPHLCPQHLHELEDGLFRLLLPQKDRDSRLVKIWGDKVNDLRKEWENWVYCAVAIVLNSTSSRSVVMVRVATDMSISPEIRSPTTPFQEPSSSFLPYCFQNQKTISISMQVHMSHRV